MDNSIALIFIASLLLQVASVVFALRMLRLSRVRLPWILLALALAVMGLFRAFALLMGANWLTWGEHIYVQTSAFSALVISTLFFLALPAIRRLSEEEQTSADARKEVEQRLASLINHMPAEIFIKDNDGRYVMVNQRMLESVNLPLDRVVGHSGAQVLPEVHQRLSTHLEAVRRTRTPITREYTLMRNGHRQDLLTTIFPLIDSDNTLRALCGIGTDVTALKTAQQSLRDTAERLRLGMLAGDVGTWDWDMATNRMTWSDRIYAFHGLTAAEFDGTVEGFQRLIHPEDQSAVKQAILRALKERSSYQIEFRTIRPDGSVRWLSTNGQAFYDESGRAVRMMGATADVTERKRLSDELIESQRFVRRVLDTTPDQVYVMDIDERRITYKNRPFRVFMGHTITHDEPGEDERFILESVHPEDRHLVGSTGERLKHLGDGLAADVEYRQLHADGTYHWVAARETVFNRNPDGSVRQILGTAEDVTARRIAEAERDRSLQETRQAREEAERANAAKDRFLAVLSHELRTPLNPVLMAVSAMTVDPEISPETRRELAMVRRNIDLEVRLIDDLLDIGRIQSGKLRVEAKPTSIHELVRQAHDICRDDLRERKLELSAELCAARDTVMGDPARLQQVLWNVIKNAIKFTPEGGRIWVRTRDGDEGRITIEIEDNGAGISDELLPRLFNAFEQGRLTESRQMGGLGLGLAIARAIVDAHQGTISAASAGENRGSTFTITLPARSGAAETPSPEPAPLTPAGKKLRVLLVEDHADTRKVLVKLLTLFGYDVTAADSVEGGLAAMDEVARFDVLISDIGLPDGDGYGLMRAAKGKYDIKGICMSGYGMDEDIRKSREAGFCDHVVKPVDVAKLREVVAKVVEGSS